MKNRIAPRPAKYGLLLRLSTDEHVQINLRQLDDALGLAKRASPPGEFWEVVDNWSGNLLASSETHGEK